MRKQVRDKSRSIGGSASGEKRKLKFGVVADASCAPTLWEMQTGRVSGVCEVVPIIMVLNGEVVLNYLGRTADEFDHVAFMNRKRTDEPGARATGTAAPNPAQFQVAFQQALTRHERVISLHIGSQISAIYKNACRGREMLPEADRERVVCFDTWGFLFGSAPCWRRALELAANGECSMHAALEHLKRVRSRSYSYFQLNSTGMRKMVQIGRVDKALAQFCNNDDAHFSGCIGVFPGEPSYEAASGPNVVDPGEKVRAGTYGPLKMPPPTSLVANVFAEDGSAEASLRGQMIDKLLAGLGDTECVRDLFVFCVGRIDKANALAKEYQQRLGDRLMGEPEVVDAPWFCMMGAHLMSWGSTAVGYWVDDTSDNSDSSSIFSQ